MANTVTQIMEKLDTSTGWLSATNITGTHGCYVIGIKGTKAEGDVFDIKDLKYVVIEVGIDSGIENKPITLTRIKLNFADPTSSDEDLNNKTALSQLVQLPSTIYLKPIAFGDQIKEYTSGKMPVSVNVIPF